MFQFSVKQRQYLLRCTPVNNIGTRCVKSQQMHFNFIDVILLYYGHRYVSASHVAIFRAISLRTETQL